MTGKLWKNTFKEKENQPDYTGIVNVDDGAGERKLSAWINNKEGQKPSIGISIGDPKEQSEGTGGGYQKPQQQQYQKPQQQYQKQQSYQQQNQQDDLPF